MHTASAIAIKTFNIYRKHTTGNKCVCKGGNGAGSLCSCSKFLWIVSVKCVLVHKLPDLWETLFYDEEKAKQVISHVARSFFFSVSPRYFFEAFENLELRKKKETKKEKRQQHSPNVFGELQRFVLFYVLIQLYIQSWLQLDKLFYGQKSAQWKCKELQSVLASKPQCVSRKTFVSTYVAFKTFGWFVKICTSLFSSVDICFTLKFSFALRKLSKLKQNQYRMWVNGKMGGTVANYLF